MSFVYGNKAGPGPSYYRAVIDQSWQDQGNGYYNCCANIRVQVTDGNFGGTYVKTTWGAEGNIYGVGDSYCFKDLGCRLVAYGSSWEITGSATYNNHKSTVSHTFKPPHPKYTVSYNANGGSGAPGAQTKIWGTSLTLSWTTPSRSGYNFKGWATSQGGGVAYQPGGTYTANAGITLYAVWELIYYGIYYNANGGSGAPGTQWKPYGQTLTLSSVTPTRHGYNFAGWATSQGGGVAYYAGDSYTANYGTTLYAVWNPVSCSVTFNANGGTDAPPKQTYSYSESGSITLLDKWPVRTGHTFTGWSLDKSASSPTFYAGQTWAKSNIGHYTLYAVWKVNTYTITYDANGGNDSPRKHSYTYDPTSTIRLSTSIPKRIGYKFLGWSKDKYAVVPSYNPGDSVRRNVTENTTLYAVWKRNGQLSINENGAWKKGRLMIKYKESYKIGLPWIKSNGEWKRGGV